MDLVGNSKLFLKLYYRPLSAMSGIIDQGSWLLGVILAVAVAGLLQFSVTSYIYSTYEAQPARPAHPSRSFVRYSHGRTTGVFRGTAEGYTRDIAQDEQSSGGSSQGDEDTDDDEYPSE